MLKFKEFLEKNYSSIWRIYKGGLFKVTGEEDDDIERISALYFDVERMEVSEMTSNGYELWVNVKWHGMWKEEKEYYITFSDSRINWSDIRKDLSEYKSKYETAFVDMLKKYVSYCALQTVNLFEKEACSGWRDAWQGKEYIGVTDREHVSYKNLLYPFQYDMKSIRKSQIEEEDIELLSEIFHNTQLLGIFAYTIHSIFLPFCGALGTDDVFSICICGEDMEKVKRIANLFSNILLVNVDRADLINKQASISCTSIHVKDAIKYKYRCMPMLITHKKDNIVRSSSIINYCQKKREQGKISFFPVFLSKRAINVDEIIDFMVDDVTLSFDFQKAKILIDTLLWRFICYLTDVSQNQGEYRMLCNEYRSVLKFYGEQGKLDCDTQRYNVILYVAMRGFKCFLDAELKNTEYVYGLDKKWQTYFIDGIKENAVNGKQAYGLIQGFAEFIDNCMCDTSYKNICFLQEEKKSGVMCYYIDYKKFYDVYTKFTKQKQLLYASKNELLRLLKQEGMLIMRANEAQYSVKRVVSINNKKVKLDVIIIKRDLLKMRVEDTQG